MLYIALNESIYALLSIADRHKGVHEQIVLEYDIGERNRIAAAAQMREVPRRDRVETRERPWRRPAEQSLSTPVPVKNA